MSAGGAASAEPAIDNQTTSRLYRVIAKNITVSVVDDVYPRACIRAALMNTSVPVLVRDGLDEIAESETEFGSLECEVGWRTCGFRVSQFSFAQPSVLNG